MIVVTLFWLLTLLSCGYAVAFGGAEGRSAAFMIVAASFLTIPARRLGVAWASTEMLILAVDLALLAGFYILMVASRRQWPVWMTGFHLIAVVTHLSTMISPGFTPKVYRALEAMWAIPVLLSLLIGVDLDRRARRRSEPRT